MRRNCIDALLLRGPITRFHAWLRVHLRRCDHAPDCAETLEPMPVGAADFRVRTSGVLAAMGVDLRARVCDDRDDEDRWPRARLQSQCASAASWLLQLLFCS